jgi:hypothetical protein
VSNTSGYRRTADQYRRRWGATGTGVGIAIGGAMAAAFVSMGTASADDLVGPATDADAVTLLLQTVDPTPVTAAAVPAATLDEFEQWVLAIDPNAFTTTDLPNDVFGQLAVQIDTDLANLPAPSIGPAYLTELNTLATQVFCAENPTCEPTLVITPPATGDNGFTVLEQFLVNTYIPEIAPVVIAPTLASDLATIASQLDAYFAPTVFGPEFFTIASQIVAAL